MHSEVAVERVSGTLQRKRDGFGGAKDSRNVLFIRIFVLVLRTGFFAVLHFLVAKNCKNCVQRKRDGFGGAKDSRNVLFICIFF